jgi:hypothetical protein
MQQLRRLQHLLLLRPCRPLLLLLLLLLLPCLEHCLQPCRCSCSHFLCCEHLRLQLLQHQLRRMLLCFFLGGVLLCAAD